MGYMMKYKGKYRLLTEIDESINDFARDDKGTYVDDDVYITCKYGRIYHYVGSTLTAWVGSLKGISRAQKYNSLVKEFSDIIHEDGRISGDGEGSFRFDAKDIDKIAKAMGVKTSGSKTSPFSTKNLPKADYKIPKDDLDRMKKVTKKFVDSGKLHLITGAYKQFGVKYKDELGGDISDLCREHMLKPKELYHKLGYFDKLIEYLKCIEV